MNKLLLLCFVLMTVPLQASSNQPHMDAAIELLQAAKKSDQPLPMLIAARKHIQKARANKGGERPDAAESVNAAIAFATTGDRAKMEAKINDAIAHLHSGISKGR